MKKVNCILLETSDYKDGKLLPKVQTKCYDAGIVIRGDRIIKNRYGAFGTIKRTKAPNVKS